jgi:LPXTG-motif cell wall-anchored protein
METKNIIYGILALAVVGGGAYFFLKNKKSKDASKLSELEKLSQGLGTGLTTTGSTSSPVTNASIGLPNAPVTNAQLQANQQELVNLTQATSLINQIVSLRKTKKSIPPFRFGNVSTWASEQSSVLAFNTGVDNQIANLNAQLKLLGYREDNGLAVKI